MSDVTKNTVGGEGALSSATAKMNADALANGANVASAIKVGGTLNSVTNINGGINNSIETMGDALGNRFVAAHDKKSTAFGPTMTLAVTKESNPQLFSAIAQAWKASIAQYNVTRNQQLGSA